MYTTKDVLPHLRLRFNIEHPGFEECYQDGFQAAQSNLLDDENPYQEGSSEHQYWSEGWWAGFYDEEAALSDEVVQAQADTPAYFNQKAANEDDFGRSEVVVWATRVAKIAGVIAVAVAAFELLDMAS